MRSLVIVVGAVAGLGASNGGFFPDSWGLALVLLGWAALLTLLLDRTPTLPERGPLYLAAACAVAVWTALGMLWSDSLTSTALEAERALLVAVALGALLLSADRAWLLRGVVAAAVVLDVWNLVARGGGATGSDAVPFGYVNGLAALSAISIPLALRERWTWPALVVLVSELATSGSRGSLLALALGGAVALTRRPVLVVPAAVIALAVAWTAAGPRHLYYRVALAEARAAPVAGTGAGTWDEWWLRRRAAPTAALDAHSVYLETLGEQGAVGLLLLCALLATPLAAAPRDFGAVAAYATFIVHAGVDWDLEQPALWIAGLAVGAALLPRGRRTLRRSVAVAAGVAAAAVAAVGCVSAFSQLSLARAVDAARAGDYRRAETLARRAGTVEPWSSRPLETLGEAQLAAGDDAAAARTFTRALAKDPRRWQLWHDLHEADGSRRAGREARLLNPLGG